MVDRDLDAVPAIGGGFTIRSSGVIHFNWIAAVADNADGYTGANVVWSGLNGVSGSAEEGWLVEVGAA